MKKLVVLVLVLGLASAAMAAGTITLNRDVPKTGTAPSLNGTIAAGEWSDALALTINTATVTGTGYGGATWNGGNGAAPDFDATYYMKWDSTHLYIAADITDDDYYEDPTPAGGTNDGDEAQFGFTLGTPSSGGAILWDMAASTSGGGPAQFHEHDPWGHGGYGLTAASSIAGSVGGAGYVIEAAIAWSDLNGYTPVLNDVHSMYIVSPDYESAGNTSIMTIGEGTWFGEYSPPNMNTMTLVIPEPATMLLLGLGGLALIRRKR